MKSSIPDGNATNEAVELRRKEWQDLVDLHEAYNKHEIYEGEDDSLCVCKLCGLPMMKKESWRSSSNKTEFKRMNLGMAKRDNNNWEAGPLTAATIKRVPKAYRHFIYEALLSRIVDPSTSEEEMAAILSCRDASVPSENLRKYALTTGGMFSYAFAKSQSDWGVDLLAATRTSAKATVRFLAESKIKPSDADRIAVSAEPDLALQFARDVDKGPHQVTRDGAAKSPDTAMHYAADIDKNPDTMTSRGTLLRTIVLRTSDGLRNWCARFKGNVPPDDKSRKAACRTKYGAFQYASMVDRAPHPDTEKILIYSAYYGHRYMYEVACAPVKNIECSFSGGFDALKYMGVFHVKPSSMLEDNCRRNSTTWAMYSATVEQYKKPIDKKAALKKSLLSAAYILVNDCYDDKELMKRAKANRGYGWILDSIKRTKLEIARRIAKRQTAAAKPVGVSVSSATALPSVNAAVVYEAMCPTPAAVLPLVKVAAKTVKLKTAAGVRTVPVYQL